MSILETLKERSPALVGELCRRLSAAEAAEIAELYLLAERNSNASFEADIFREDGVNFNPRAARVLQLVLEEPKATSSDLKLALACLSNPALARLTDFNIQSAKIAPFFQSQAKLEELKKIELSFSECLVLLAILLDDMRHLHMKSIPEAKKQSQAITLKKSSDLITASFNSSTFPNLKAKCDAQCLRLSRMFDAPNS
jgi:hypothetical protein